jgi:hypothetical protein
MLLRFIGQNNSMGLKKGMVYRLTIKPWQEHGVLIEKPVTCPYSTQASFWRNWEIPN